MQRTVLSACLILATALASHASEIRVEDDPARSERRYAFEQTELSNGLRVISLEDFSCPIVAVQLWYHVGSKNEEPRRQGFAHMFEHMMFRGTDRLNETAHFDNVRRWGGDCNAYTSFDNTTYIQKVPANQLEMVLWLESERMVFLKIDQKGFDTERRVVEEELRQGHNRPYGRVPEKVLAELYGDQCYGWTPGGQIADLRAAKIEELAAFWNKYYVPNNATLVVVGAVKHADIQALAKTYFEWIPRCPDVMQPPLTLPPQEKTRTITLKEDKGPLPVVGALFRVAPDSHPDHLPLQVLMGVLGGGESSRLYVDAVKDQKIAQVALGAAFSLESDGLAGAGGVLLPFGKKKELMQTVKKHIKQLREAPITSAELEKMKNQLRRQEVEGALSIESKARLLGQYAVLRGDAEMINRHLAEIDAVTADDVLRVAKKYLTDERRVSILVEPNAAGMLGSLLSKEDKDAQADQPIVSDKDNHVVERAGPKAKAVRPKDFPSTPPAGKLIDAAMAAESSSKKLSNGLSVVVVPNHEVPMVTMVLGIKSGSWSESKPGIANFTMDMLTKGTKTCNAKKLAEVLESNAINLAGSTTIDAARVTASAVVPQLDLAAELLRDVIENPTFPKDEFDILSKQTKMGLLISSNTPEYLADRELRRRIYGDHPYARTETGELNDLDKVKLEDLRAWWGEHIRPENCVLYLAGDIKPTDGMKLAEKHLASWKVNGSFNPMKMPEIPPTKGTHIFLMDRPGSVQSQIRIGLQGITRRDPDYPVARVMATIFGGGFNSRLNKAIRVDKGLTYGARGSLSAQRFAGDVRISTFTKTPKTGETLTTILTEIDRLRTAPPTTEELADTQSYIVGSFPGARETPEATVGDLWMIETEGLPKDYFETYLDGVRHATPEAVLESAKSMIDPKKLNIIVVGEAKAIQADLEKIAPVTVINQVTPPPEQKEEPATADD
ncbi:MAG: pitrilysin family protein [Planctomycetota bacterium]